MRIKTTVDINDLTCSTRHFQAMCQPVVHENTARQREHLRLVLKPPEGAREYQPVVVALKFRPRVPTLVMKLLQTEPPTMMTTKASGLGMPLACS